MEGTGTPTARERLSAKWRGGIIMTGERELPDGERETGGEEASVLDWVPSRGGVGAKNPTFRTFGSITREGRRLLSMV